MDSVFAYILQGLALLTLSWDKNWDSHSLVNGYPSFYPRIALVAPSPDCFIIDNVEMITFSQGQWSNREGYGLNWLTPNHNKMHELGAKFGGGMYC